jgi:hypothetical protein
MTAGGALNELERRDVIEMQMRVRELEATGKLPGGICWVWRDLDAEPIRDVGQAWLLARHASSRVIDVPAMQAPARPKRKPRSNPVDEARSILCFA